MLDLLDSLSKYLQPEALKRTSGLALRPEEGLRRVLETLELTDGNIVRRVTLELAAAESGGPFLVPLLRPDRGVLLENFTIEESPSTIEVTLNRQESQFVARLMLITAATSALSQSIPNRLRTTDVFNAVALQATLARIGQIPFVSPETSKPLVRLLRLLSNAPVDSPHPSAEMTSAESYLQILRCLSRNDDFIALASFFRLQRLILAPLVMQDALPKITFAYETGLREVGTGTRREALRAFFGHSPYELRPEIPLALRSPSYHLRLRAPNGHYVRLCEALTTRYRFPQHPQRIRDWEVEPFVAIGSECFVEGRRTSAGTLAHIYLGNAHRNASPPRRLFAHVVVNERPAGSIGVTLVRSSVVLGTIGAVRILAEALHNTGNSNVVALLLALPGVLSLGAAGGDARKDGLIMAPLAARLGALIAGVAAFVSALLFLWFAATAPIKATSVPTVISWAFAAVLLSVGTVVGWCALRFVMNLRHFREARRTT